MNKRWDVLGIGCGTVDELLYVEAYPPADAKVAVTHRERQCGGLTATALVAAARQGVRCAYGGAMGHDEDSEFLLTTLQLEGIDTTPVVRNPRAGAIHSTIIVDQTAHTRNIFFQRPQIIGPTAGSPTSDQIRSARVLFADHYGGEATVRAQRIAREAGIPVVADLERENVPAFAEILGTCDHLIVSQHFAAKLSGRSEPADSAKALLQAGKRIVIITCGAAGCWAVSKGETTATHFPAFPVEVVDTTGCGDTFHGVYTAELARGTSLPTRITRASAAAALKARRRGAQAGIPTRLQVDEMLAGTL